VPLPYVALLSLLQGVAEVLPISLSGHDAALALWLPPGRAALGLVAVLHLATVLALSVVMRRRLFALLHAGVRAVARPSLFRSSPAARDAALIGAASAVSLGVSAAIGPWVRTWSAAPGATGLGLVATGLAVGSLSLAPRSHLEAPSLLGALAVGLGHGLAGFPGASRIGAALTLLIWMGVKPSRALDLVFLISVPTLLGAFVAGMGRGSALASLEASGAGGAGTIAAGLLIAFLSALLASAGLRSLAERRRVGALALWIIPLGLAMLAYARALPNA
jgi:undecaprenyl-diphosphatase